MNSLRAWIRKRPMAAYYMLAVGLSWSYWLALIVSHRHVGPGSRATHVPGLLAPMLAATAVTGAAFGLDGMRDLLRRAVMIPMRPAAGVLAAISPLLLGLIVFVALSLHGAPLPSLRAFADYPGLPIGQPLWLAFLAALVLNGYGEEVGWRGFATHHLAARLGRFRATLVVAGLWLFWHAPLFWLVTSMHALLGPALIGWAAGLAAGAFVLSALYLASRSILVVAVWHTLFNFVVATPPGTGTPAAVMSTVVIVWGMAIALLWWRSEHEHRDS
jgi:membrane protease YdiL (CAAX protease family)